jgi:hypothetical protein
MITVLHIRSRDVQHPQGRTLELTEQDIADLVTSELGNMPVIVDDWNDPNTMVVVDLNRDGVSRARRWRDRDAKYTNRNDRTRPQAGTLIRLATANGGRR